MTVFIPRNIPALPYPDDFRKAIAIASLTGFLMFTGVVVVLEPRLVFVGAAGLIAVVAWIISFRYQIAPFLLILAANCVTAVLWFSPIQGETGRREELELYGVAMGAAIAIGVGIIVLQHQSADLGRGTAQTKFLDHIVFVLFPVLALMSLVVGLIRDNSPSYLLGDTYRLLLIPCIYFVTTRAITSHRQFRYALIALVMLVLAQQVWEALPGIQFLLQGDIKRIHSLLWMENLVGVLAAVVLASHSRKTSQRAFWLLCSVTLVGIGLLSAFRTYILIVGLIPILLIAVNPRLAWRIGGRIAIPGILVGTTCLAVALLVTPVGAVLSTTTSSLQGRLEVASDTPGEDVSLAYRWWEIKLVYNQLNEPFALLAGLGSGAVHNLDGAPSIYAIERYAASGYQAHHIHNTLAANAYRIGLLGLLSFPILFAAGIRCAYQTAKRARDALYVWPVLAIVSFAFASLLFSHVVGHVLFPVALGMATVMARTREHEDEQFPGRIADV